MGSLRPHSRRAACFRRSALASGYGMCFSPEVSFTAAAVLAPAGAIAMRTAWSADRRYLPLCTLPLLFAAQQFFEGMVWLSDGDPELLRGYSIAYLFFAWLAWPIWIPFSVYWLEPARRQPFYLVAAIAGAVLGAGQFLPYLAHDAWVQTNFLPRAVVYGGKEMVRSIIGEIPTYAIYLTLVILPSLFATDRRVKLFGVLIAAAFSMTYLFFRYAYISVFCFWGAIMSLYLVWTILRHRRDLEGLAAPAA